MKRLTITVAVLLATLLVVRPPLYAQNESGNPGMGDDASGQDDSDQQVAPDQPSGGGGEASDQSNDTSAASDQNDEADQNDQNDNDQATSESGSSDDANSANP